MNDQPDFSKPVPDLRRQAERRMPAGAVPPAPTYLERLVHELQVHQVELELQNEELLQTQRELQRARDRYIDLFDYAPVGFVTLDADGCIVEANLTLALWLGVNAGRLSQQSFARFVSAEDAPHWNQCFKRLLFDAHRSTCLLKLLPDDGTTLYARLHLAKPGMPANVTVRVAVVDISEIEYRGLDSHTASAKPPRPTGDQTP
jgi:PAS domain S-box-containing protein